MKKTTLRATLSSTPIAKEYRFVNDAMVRYARKVRAFDAGPYDPNAVARARRMWLSRMESEHRSASVFAGLCGQLMEAGATFDMESIVLRMAQDEIRHADLCAEMVVALGGEAHRLVDAPTAPLAVHRQASREECALRNIIYGCCLSESINCARFVDAIDSMSDPLTLDVTKQLLSDEALHSQFGFHYLDAWSPWLVSNPEAVESMTRYLRYAFAVLEKDLSGREQKKMAITEDERALGVDDPRRSEEVFYTTVEGAIVPALERYGLGAARSWAHRSLTP